MTDKKKQLIEQIILKRNEKIAKEKKNHNAHCGGIPCHSRCHACGGIPTCRA